MSWREAWTVYGDFGQVHALVQWSEDQTFPGRHEPIGIQAKSWIDLESVQNFVRTPFTIDLSSMLEERFVYGVIILQDMSIKTDTKSKKYSMLPLLTE